MMPVDEKTTRDTLLDKHTVTREESTTYRIISKNVSEYHFTIPYKERVEVGEIFSIEDKSVENEKITFLARVTDIRHDSNYEGNWDTTLRGTEFYDQDQIFNRVVAEPLGCIIEDRFRKSRMIPAKFSPVKRAETKELKFLSDVMGDIEVGVLRNGSEHVEDFPVALHSDVMDHHMGVFATTGMGKSNFMKVFAASCMKKAVLGESKFGLLIVDPHGEYILGDKNTKGLLHLKNYHDGLVCYSTDPEHSKDAEVSKLAISKEEIVPGDTHILFDWRSAQKEVLEAIPYIFDEKTWIDEIQTENGRDDLLSEHFHERTIDVVQRRIKSICRTNRYIKNIESSIPGIISHLQEGKVVLIDIPNLRERSELFLLSILSRHILGYYRKYFTGNGGKKRCLITIEEAQRVLGGGEGSLARFESIAREGRKFGVGLCAITQQPKLIDKQLLSQFNTFVILGLADRNDRTRLEESAKQDLSSLDVEIQTLEKGEAIISTLNIPFPVPAKIYKYEDYMETLNKEERPGEIAHGGFNPPPD
ncbi:MAG: ATP-binding protein [Methanotrichaceae archaeon]